MTQCKNTRRTGTLSMHRCERPAVLDGYCVRHHHRYWAPKDWAALSDEERAELTAVGRSPEHFAADIAAARPTPEPHHD